MLQAMKAESISSFFSLFTFIMFKGLCRPIVASSARALLLRKKYTHIHVPVTALSSNTCYPPMRFYSEDAKDKAVSNDTKKYLLDRDAVKQRVIDVVKNFEKVDPSKVTESSHFIDDLNLDSLDVVEVVMALEQEFILDMPDHDAERITSIKEAIEYIATNPMAK